jgi:hypothetical protein
VGVTLPLEVPDKTFEVFTTMRIHVVVFWFRIFCHITTWRRDPEDHDLKCFTFGEVPNKSIYSLDRAILLDTRCAIVTGYLC